MYPIKMKVAAVLLAGIAVSSAALATIRNPVLGQDKPMVGVDNPGDSKTLLPVRENIRAAQAEPPDPQPRSDSHVYQVAYSRDGRHLALSHGKSHVFDGVNMKEIGEHKVTLIDTATYKELLTLTGPTATTRGLAFTVDGKTLFAACDDGMVYSWDVATGKEGTKLEAGAGRAASLAVSPDGKYLATVHVQDPWLNHDLPSSWVQLWDLKTLKSVRILKGVKGDSGLRGDDGVRFSPDSESVAAIFATDLDDEKLFAGVVEWSTATGKELRRFPAVSITDKAKAMNTSLAFTPDGKWLVVGGSELIPDPKTVWTTAGHIWVFDRRSGKLHKTLPDTAPDNFMAVNVSADGKRLYATTSTPVMPGVLKNGTRFTGSFSSVVCWDTDTWKPAWTATGQPGSPMALGESPSGKRVVLSDTTGVVLFDAKNGEPRGGLVEHDPK
jgi:WD40 repeat protein